MKSRVYAIFGILISLTIIFFILGPSQGHIAKYFLTEEQFEDLILNSDNSDRYLTYDKSLTITFSPLNLENVELSFDWCIKNNGFWNEDNSTCYFENQKDLNSGMNAIKQYGENVFGEIENEK
jgi:hypothetical protein